jgi:hypothetical protein
VLRESLPRPFDLRNRDTGLPQEVSERVEPLALGLATPKRARRARLARGSPPRWQYQNRLALLSTSWRRKCLSRRRPAETISVSHKHLFLTRRRCPTPRSSASCEPFVRATSSLAASRILLPAHLSMNGLEVGSSLTVVVHQEDEQLVAESVRKTPDELLGGQPSSPAS